MDTKSADNFLDSLLKAAGLSRGNFYKIRFGGFVGKTAWICTIAEVPVAIVAFRTTNPIIQFSALIAAIAIAITGAVVASRFAQNNPNLAMLEGAQVIAFHELQGQLAAKGVKEIPQQTPTTKTLEVKVIEQPKGTQL